MTVRQRRLLGVGALAAALAVAALASLAFGSAALSFTQVWQALFEPTGQASDAIVRELRVPRTLVGLIVGVALGVAGALIQGHTRNPLADTGLLGLNAGAALLVAASMHLFGFTQPAQYIWFAVAGALVAGIVVFGVASIGGKASPLSIAIAGAAVTFFMQALTSAIVLIDVTTLDSFRFWIVGSVGGRGLDVLWQVLPFLAVGLLLAVVNTPALNVLNLGDDVARALGGNLAVSRAVGLASVTLLSAGATAACGPIAFVGLVVPHVARAITGPDYRWLVPYAGLLGGVLLVGADVLGRLVVRPGELDVGVMLALLGAPFFILLVRQRKLAAL